MSDSAEQRALSVEPRRGAFLSLVPALLYLVTAFYVGSLHRDPLVAIHFELKDKLLHALFFGIMQRTHFRALAYLLPRAEAAKLGLLGFFTAVSAGILLEIWQGFLPYRSADVWDALADAAGAALFTWLFWPRGEDRDK